MTSASQGHSVVPIGQPVYGASFGTAISRFFKGYAQFKGRASRAEYWWVQLVLYVLYSILYFVHAATGVEDEDRFIVVNTEEVLLVVELLLFVALIVPTLALTWRRLHDAGFAGPWFFISFVPLVGPVVLIVMTLMGPAPHKMKANWEGPGLVSGRG